MTVEFGKNLDSSSVKAAALPFGMTADNCPQGLGNSMQNICQQPHVTVQYTVVIPKAGKLPFASQIEMGWCGQGMAHFATIW